MKSQAPAAVPEVIEADEAVLAEDMQSKATEFIKDRAAKLDWDQMQRLVAGVLRAMGYKTRISPAGPDRGKDIIASPDGLGFESPRIVVEVKHRQGAMGSQEIRSFLGGRHKDDKGLYVSTGGFTKDARYEADRASIPLSLMNIDELVEAVIENYETLDNETKQLLPLRRLYWPN
jgi:restriction system protein